MLDGLVAYLKIERGLSQSTINNYISDLEHYLKSTSNPLAPEEVNKYLMGLDAKPATAWRKRSAIVQLFKFLWEEEVLTEDLTSKFYRPAKPNSLPKALDDSISDLLDFFASDTSSVGLRKHSFIQLLYDSAMRVSECAKIKIKDWHHDKILITGKGNKQRWVFLQNKTLELLLQYMSIRHEWAAPGNQYLWGRGTTKHILRQTVHRWLQEAGNSLGISVSPHVLRHTQATKLLPHMNIVDLAGILGHASINTTSRYLKVNPAGLQERLRELGWE